MKSDRAYHQTLRAQKALDAEARILDEAERLFSTIPFDRVTLDAVARAANVSIPTLQRRFGNKEGLFAACGERMRARIHTQRGTPPAGDVSSAVKELIAHYEAEGALVWNLLRQENDVAALVPALAEGRATHRAWVTTVFGKRPRAEIDVLTACTDLYIWKLWRVDMGRSRAEVETMMIAMAQAVAGPGGTER